MRIKKLLPLILFGGVVILLGLVFFINYFLMKEPGESPTTVKKSKAAAKTYNKTIDMGEIASSIPTAAVSPETETGPSPVPTNILIASNDTQTNQAANPTGVSSGLSPSPTAALEAYNSVTGTEEPTVIITGKLNSTPTVAPTKMSSLPESGRVDYTATILALASLLIFFSFLY